MVYKLKMAQIEEVDINQLELPFCSEEDFISRLEQDGFMNDLVTRALSHAKDFYAGRKRDSGRPFLNEHIFPVTLGVVDHLKRSEKTLEEQIVSATILHDALEEDPESKRANPYEVEQIIQRDIKDPHVYKFIYHQTKITAKGNSDVNGIYMSKLERSNENSQVISVVERMNNLYCSICNAKKLPKKLRMYDEVTRRDFLPIADSLRDTELSSHLHAILDLSSRAMAQLGIVEPVKE
jgi:hypothetical protein